jgi:hypothetical protein
MPPSSPTITRMYSKHGWIDVANLDARQTCERLPAEWTLEKWQRPEGFPDVNIPPAWQEMSARQRILLARQIDSSAEIQHAGQAAAVIRKYLADTKHPKEAVANV